MYPLCPPVWMGLLLRMLRLKSQKKGIFPKSSKYQQSNWHTIGFELIDQALQRTISSQI